MPMFLKHHNHYVGIALSIYWIKYPPPKVGDVVEGGNGKIYASQEDMDRFIKNAFATWR